MLLECGHAHHLCWGSLMGAREWLLGTADDACGVRGVGALRREL